MLYILEGHTPVPCDDDVRWAVWFKTTDRRVACTTVGPLRVSTVFIGLDYSWDGGPPLVFETMIFDGGEDAYQERCSTWEEAERQHEEAVAEAQRRVAAADAILPPPIARDP